MNTTSIKYDPIDAQGVYLTLAVLKGERHLHDCISIFATIFTKQISLSFGENMKRVYSK